MKEVIRVMPLPEVIDIEWVKNGIGLDPTYHMIQNYDKMIDLCYKVWMYHFEFLNLGYAAYLDFFGYCKEAFPGIPDLSVAKMVQGVEVDLFRPDEELQKLSRLAVKLNLQDVIQNNEIEKALEVMDGSAEGKEWIAAWEEAKYPWFNFTVGNGFYSTDKYWIEHLEIPFGYIQSYVERVLKGETIERPTEKIAAERERITEEYRDSLPDEDAQNAFDQKLGLARVVFPYVEEVDDMFYFRREEIQQLLFDYGRGWAMGVPAIGPDYLPTEIARRKKIIDALATAPPESAFNKPPEVVTEPFTIMLWGITTESVQGWLSSEDTGNKLKGMAASPGKVEGRARVISSSEDLGLLEEGEILVTRVTAPSWAPVFGKIKATVTDIGGMMSHAAIVCREYDLPAVTGTGNASTKIKTGDMLLVDGGSGTVEILA